MAAPVLLESVKVVSPYVVSDLIQSFKEEFSYDVQSDKFNMAEYEENITDNLNRKISNDIIFLLGTLK